MTLLLPLESKGLTANLYTSDNIFRKSSSAKAKTRNVQLPQDYLTTVERQTEPHVGCSALEISIRAEFSVVLALN